MRLATAVVAMVAGGLLSGCGSSSATPAGPEIDATWSWTGGLTKCSDLAGATQVDVIATLAGTATVYDQKFPCGANAGTLALPAKGSYVVYLSLQNAGGMELDGSVPATHDVQGPVSVTGAFDGVP